MVFYSEELLLSRIRTGKELLGTIDGSNKIFTVPGSEKFVQQGSVTITVYVNGSRQDIADYTVSESGGAGTGYDTVTFDTAPVSGPVLADFILSLQ